MHVLYMCVPIVSPSPTLSPTDPVPRGLLTLCPGLHIYIYMCVYIYICNPGHRPETYCVSKESYCERSAVRRAYERPPLSTHTIRLQAFNPLHPSDVCTPVQPKAAPPPKHT